MQTVGKANSTNCVSVMMLGLLGAASLGIYWSMRLAVANWLETRATLNASVHAIALAPGNEEYLRRAAEIAEESGQDGTGYYKQGAMADPYAAKDWVQLGFHAERDGRYEEAERNLLKAVRVDQSFELRWTLANFYFRRGEISNTLYWIRKALCIGEGDLTSVFRLCWQVTEEPARISQEAIPNRAAVLGRYLEFLFSTNRFDDSTAIAIRLAGIAGRNQVGALLDYCDQALAAGLPDKAAIIWNSLSHRDLISQPTIGRNSAHTVRNPNFRSALTGRGFDWKTSVPGGVLADNGGADGLRIEFSGKQADESVILSQYVHLTPGTRYALHVRYQSEGIASGTGLRWRILNPLTSRDVEGASLELPCAGGEAYAPFIVPRYLRWGRLQLLYNRRPGTNRIEGRLQLILVDIAAEK